MSWTEALHESSGQIASRSLHLTIAATLGAFVAAFIAACVFHVEVVAQGVGIIVPAKRVQVVQAEFSGAVSAIETENGAVVAEGDILVRLDDTTILARLNALRLERTRLEAEDVRIETSLDFLNPATSYDAAAVEAAVTQYRQRAPMDDTGFVEEQARLLTSEIALFATVDNRFASDRRAAEHATSVTRARLDAIDEALEIGADRLSMRKELRDRGVTSEDGYLVELQAFRALEGERQVLRNVLTLDGERINQLEAEREAFFAERNNILRARRARIGAEFQELDQDILVLERRLKSVLIKAPMAGVVDQLGIHTIGGVVASGQEIMRIVPLDQSYELEASFANAEVGFLEAGQVSNIKLEAYPSERYGSLRGVVLNVSADSVQDEAGDFAFIARIAPDTPYLEQAGVRYGIQPGMTAQVDVITGERRLISYFFAPIVKALDNSLGER